MMLLWLIAGFFAGGIASCWANRPQLTIAALVAGLVGLFFAAASSRFALDALVACIGFWIAAQGGWFVGNLAFDARNGDRVA